MPAVTRAKTRKHSKNRHQHQHKTRNHSNLRPKHRHSKDFLKVYYPYLPLVTVLILIISILQPWHSLQGHNDEVLAYATQMSVSGLINETNERRQANQQPTLELDTQLSEAAQSKANDMVARDYWSHNTPEGNAPWEFINNAGYSYKKAGENLAYGFRDEDEVIAGWMNSPGHRANMLDASYQEVGFGFAQSKDFVDGGPATVVVAMYGQPSGAPVPLPVASATPSGTYNTLGLAAEPEDTVISRIQAVIVTPTWANYAIVAVVSALGAYIVIKHSRRLKRVFTHGEQFIVHHPLLDATLISLIVLGILISQQTGIIR